MEVSVDGQPFDIKNLTNTTQQLNGSVDILKPEENCFEMGFPSGMSVKVCANLNQLSIIAAAPESFKSHTKGLLGTWNGDKEDDFTLPNGTVLPGSSSGRDIHYKFGMTCKTKNYNLYMIYCDKLKHAAIDCYGIHIIRVIRIFLQHGYAEHH